MILFLLYNVVVGNEVGRCEFSGNDKVTSKLDKLVGDSFSTTHKINDKEYEFKVNFCGNGVADQGQSTMVWREEIDTDGNHFNGQVLGQALLESNSDSSDYTMVNFKTTSSGSYPDSSVCKNLDKSTHIILTCADLYKDGTLRVIETITDDSKTCLNLLELHTTVMCRLTFGLFLVRFIASILIIACVYFISGALYRRFSKGAQGLNQIPHLAFWSRVGNTIADKCEYMCRCTAPPSDDEIHEHRSDQPILPM